VNDDDNDNKDDNNDNDGDDDDLFRGQAMREITLPPRPWSDPPGSPPSIKHIPQQLPPKPLTGADSASLLNQTSPPPPPSSSSPSLNAAEPTRPNPAELKRTSSIPPPLPPRQNSARSIMINSTSSSSGGGSSEHRPSIRAALSGLTHLDKDSIDKKAIEDGKLSSERATKVSVPNNAEDGHLNTQLDQNMESEPPKLSEIRAKYKANHNEEKGAISTTPSPSAQVVPSTSTETIGNKMGKNKEVKSSHVSQAISNENEDELADRLAAEETQMINKHILSRKIEEQKRKREEEENKAAELNRQLKEKLKSDSSLSLEDNPSSNGRKEDDKDDDEEDDDDEDEDGDDDDDDDKDEDGGSSSGQKLRRGSVVTSVEDIFSKKNTKKEVSGSRENKDEENEEDDMTSHGGSDQWNPLNKVNARTSIHDSLTYKCIHKVFFLFVYVVSFVK
jgi:hypothetical protein